jgi:5-methylcytosine-specific restriction endonuclease McrA
MKRTKEEWNAYMRARRAANPDAIRAYERAYYAANREKIAARSKAYGDADRTKRLATLNKWKAANRDHVNELSRSWKARNPEKRRTTDRNFRAKRASAEGKHTATDIKRIRETQRDCCAYCRKRLGGCGQVDHIIPLSRGGTNWPNNLQLTCASCNVRKYAKRPEEFAREKGLLL